MMYRYMYIIAMIVYAYTAFIHVYTFIYSRIGVYLHTLIYTNALTQCFYTFIPIHTCPYIHCAIIYTVRTQVEETQRPQFVGHFVHDEASGEDRKVYPFWKRFIRYSISTPLLVGVTALMVYIVVEITIGQVALYAQYVRTYHSNAKNTTNTNTNNTQYSITLYDFKIPEFWLVAFLYPCLYSILVELSTLAFNRLAEYMNKFENHRRQTTYVNRYILKTFTFRIIIVFTSLCYYAFIANTGNTAYLRISIVMFSLLTVGQYWGIILTVFIPSWYNRIKLFYINQKIRETRRQVYYTRGFIESASKAMPYHVNDQGNIVYPNETVAKMAQGKLHM